MSYMKCHFCGAESCDCTDPTVFYCQGCGACPADPDKRYASYCPPTCAVQAGPPPDGFHLYINPGHANPALVAEILETLSKMHVAAGGAGLHFALQPDGSLFVTPSRRA